MIEARDIVKRFGATIAVAGVSLHVAAGEFLTLLGPSGCGKTTLLRALAGFETPDSGSVWLDGRNVTAEPPYRRNLNQVFQGYALFPHLSVWDNIAFGLRMQRTAAGELKSRVTEAIAAVALEGLEHRRPQQLSGGQRQRVALARALVCRPRVLLLDEPLSALDARLRRTMQTELKALQRRSGLTFVFVTHDQQEAMSLSDRIAVMNGGRIEQVGTPEEIYARPRTVFAADFIGAANLLPATALTSDARQLTVRTAGGWQLTSAQPGAAPAAATVSIRPETIAIGPASGSPNRCAATVEEVVYQGASRRLTVRTEHGETLVVETGAAATPGDRIDLSVPPGAVVVIY